jgi:hypothetical protein
MATAKPELRAKVLELLKEGIWQAEIARRLNFSYSRICKIIEELEKAGTIKLDLYTSHKIYTVNPTVNPMPDTVNPTVNPMPDTVNPMPDLSLMAREGYDKVKPIVAPKPDLVLQRAHRLYRPYKLERALSSAVIHTYIQGRLIHLKNNTQQCFTYKNVQCRLTTRKLIIEGFELLADIGMLTPDLVAFMEMQADGVAYAFEAETGLKLKRTQTNALDAQTKIIEIGLTNHEIAKRAGKGYITFYIEPLTGKPALWTDTSFKLWELEGNKAAYVEKMRAFTKDIIEDRWNIRGQLGFNAASLQFQLSHNAMIEEITKYFRKLNYIRKKYGLGEAKPEEGQASLVMYGAKE